MTSCHNISKKSPVCVKSIAAFFLWAEVLHKAPEQECAEIGERIKLCFMPNIACKKLEPVADILILVRYYQRAHGFCLPIFGLHFQRNQRGR